MSFFSQFTPDQLRTQYAKNAAGLRFMLARAERTGRKVNGFTASQLRDRVATFERLAVASDATLLAHVS